MNHPSSTAGMLIFNAQQYRLAEVLRNAFAGPKIVVKRSEMAPAFPVEIKGEDLVPVNGLPVLYKHEGKYIVLAGLARYLEQAADPKFKGEYTGRLISGPMLKKARVDTSAPEPVRNTVWTDRDNDAIRNRARVMDERRHSNYGNAGRR